MIIVKENRVPLLLSKAFFFDSSRPIFFPLYVQLNAFHVRLWSSRRKKLSSWTMFRNRRVLARNEIRYHLVN